MDTNNVLGELLEQGQSMAQKTGKAVADSAAGAVKTAVSQVTGVNSAQAGTNEGNAAPTDQPSASDKAQTDELVKELYAPSNPQAAQDPVDKQQVEQDAQVKLQSIRQKLHQEVYYEPLVNPARQEEERPAEKVEREKQQELQDLQQKEAKKPAPIGVQMAQQSAEKFRGASG